MLFRSIAANSARKSPRGLKCSVVLPLRLTRVTPIIAIKNPTWLKNFSPEGERYAFLLEAAKSVFGTEPKITVRPPQAGDDKLRASQQDEDKKKTEPKKPLIIENNTPQSEEIEDAVNQKNNVENQEEDNNEDLTDSDNSEDSESTPKINIISKSDASYHSDNVNMIIDLFEGKIIE